jgi:hypothetical protein
VQPGSDSQAPRGFQTGGSVLIVKTVCSAIALVLFIVHVRGDHNER